MPDASPVPQRAFFSYVLLALLIAIPAAVLVGWVIGSKTLTSVFPQFTPMNPVTAVCFISLGCTLLYERIAHRRWPTYAAALLVLLVGGVMLLKYAFSIDLFIDRVLFPSRLGVNRMAVTTSTNFFLIGFVLFCRDRFQVLGRVLILIVFGISLYAIVAYLYNFVGVYGVSIYNPMAIHTGLCFLIAAAYLSGSFVGNLARSSRLQQTMVVVTCILCTGLLISSYTYSVTSQRLKLHALDRASLIVKNIPLGELQQLQGNQNDLDSPAYADIKARLVRIRTDSHDVDFAYVMGKSPNGDIFFYADSEDPLSPEYSPPGQAYDQASPTLKGIWHDGVARAEGPLSDQRGDWLIGYEPIQDSSGNVVAVAGADTPADTYTLAVIENALVPVMVAIVLAGLYVVFRLRSRLVVRNDMDHA